MALQTEVLLKINSKLCKSDDKPSTFRTPRPSSAQPLPSRITDELINLAKTAATEANENDVMIVDAELDDSLSQI